MGLRSADRHLARTLTTSTAKQIADEAMSSSPLRCRDLLGFRVPE